MQSFAQKILVVHQQSLSGLLHMYVGPSVTWQHLYGGKERATGEGCCRCPVWTRRTWRSRWRGWLLPRTWQKVRQQVDTRPGFPGEKFYRWERVVPLDLPTTSQIINFLVITITIMTMVEWYLWLDDHLPYAENAKRPPGDQVGRRCHRHQLETNGENDVEDQDDGDC